MCLGKETSWQAKEGAVMCKLFVRITVYIVNIHCLVTCINFQFPIKTLNLAAMCAVIIILFYFNRHDCNSVPVSLEWNSM